MHLLGVHAQPRYKQVGSNMGAPISKLRKEAREANEQERQRMEERLQILEKMVTSRLQVQKSHIIAGERGDQEIHSGTIVQEFQQVNIALSSKPSQNLEEAIDDFFSDHFMRGLGKLVHVAVATVLGNNCMGEYETSEMFIVWTDNALLRYDMYCYRWNFAAKGVIEDTEGVVGVLLFKRVIDFTKTDPQVITWAISRQASVLGRDSEVADMIDEAMKILEKVVAFQVRVRKIEAEAGLSIEYKPN